jgi:hypothetical protein
MLFGTGGFTPVHTDRSPEGVQENKNHQSK